MAALKQLIAEQKEAGADVSIGMGSSQYKWNSEGRLVGINWNHCDLKGKISFAAFPCLEELDCSDNYKAMPDDYEDYPDDYDYERYCLRGIEISNNPLLAELNLSSCGRVEILDASNNSSLKELDLGDCRYLKTLNVSNTPLLEIRLPNRFMEWPEEVTIIGCGKSVTVIFYTE